MAPPGPAPGLVTTEARRHAHPTHPTSPRARGALVFSGALGGVDFDDEDVLEYDSGGPSGSLAFDASAEHAGWGAGPDADAIYLPEPGAILMLGCGILGPAWLRTRSRAH